MQEALGTRDNPPAGGLVHAAGFDEDAGVFRIFDVWESKEAWETFFNDRVMPVVRPLMERAAMRRRPACINSTSSWPEPTPRRIEGVAAGLPQCS